MIVLCQVLKHNLQTQFRLKLFLSCAAHCHRQKKGMKMPSLPQLTRQQFKFSLFKRKVTSASSFFFCYCLLICRFVLLLLPSSFMASTESSLASGADPTKPVTSNSIGWVCAGKVIFKGMGFFGESDKLLVLCFKNTFEIKIVLKLCYLYQVCKYFHKHSYSLCFKLRDWKRV